MEQLPTSSVKPRRKWNDARRCKHVFGRLVDDRLKLYPKSRVMLQELGDGYTAEEIATRHGMLKHTVRWHLEQARIYFGTETSYKAFLAAVEAGQCVCPCRREKPCTDDI